jgi:hypothetical protein
VPNVYGPELEALRPDDMDKWELDTIQVGYGPIWNGLHIARLGRGCSRVPLLAKVGSDDRQECSPACIDWDCAIIGG